MPVSSATKEKELLAACGKHAARRALLLMQMARRQAEAHKSVALLQEASELLHQAQAQEDLLLSSQQQVTLGKSSVPLPPKVLERTPTSVTLTHFPLHLRGGRTPASYAVYCKSYGAGVALSINKTSMEYEGGYTACTKRLVLY